MPAQARFAFQKSKGYLQQPLLKIFVYTAAARSISNKTRHECTNVVALFPPPFGLFADQMKTDSRHRISHEQSRTVGVAASLIWSEALRFRVPMILLKDHLKGLH